MCICHHPDRPAKHTFYCPLSAVPPAPPKPKRLHFCSLCLMPGHNRTTCDGPAVEPMPLDETLAVAKAAGL
jgi:hypothetical protein